MNKRADKFATSTRAHEVGGRNALFALIVIFSTAMPIASVVARPVIYRAAGDLRVEAARRPLGTDVTSPRFSWLLRQDVSRQAAYRIQVARSAEALQRHQLVWDSGKVASARHAGLIYAGPRLLPRQKYFWRVQIIDQSGRSSWSLPSTWEMGLLSPADWYAQWISAPSPVEHNWSDAVIEWRFTWLGRPVDFLFRASPQGKTFGEAYAWRLTEVNGRAVLFATSRHYKPLAEPLVSERIITKIDLASSASEFCRRAHSLAVEAVGDRLLTRLDGRLIDTRQDNDHARGTAGLFQPRPDLSSPTSANAPDALVLHSIVVTPKDGLPVRADFAANDNPLSGGTPGPEGLRPDNAKGIDIVFPLDAPAPLLRRSFVASHQVVSARLYVAAGGFPRILVNGRTVGDAIRDGFTAYDRRVLYRAFDVTHLIKQGNNAIGVELGRGWYDLAEPNEWYWHMPPWRARPALKLQLELTLRNGRRQIVDSDGSWKWTAGPTLHDSIYAGERFDARRAPRNWAVSGFNDKAWLPVNVVSGPAGRLDAAKQQPIAVTQILRAKTWREAKPGVWVFDFGRIFAGRVRLRIRGPAGQTISLTKHEKLRPDGTVWSFSSHVDAQLQVDRYTVAGRGTEEWTPQFSYGGFRYVEVRGLPGAPTADTLIGEVMHSNVASLGRFESSSPLLNAIQAAARDTILNNMHGFQTDTPTFEKNGWTGDAQASALASALNFDVGPVWRKWLADFRDAQASSGEIPEIVPSTPFYGYEGTPGWSMVNGPTPAWDAAAFILPDDLYALTDDHRLLAEMYDTQRRLVDYTLRWFTPGDYRYLNDRNVMLGEYAMPAPVASGPEPAASDPSGMSSRPSEVDAVSCAYLYLMVTKLSGNATKLGRLSEAAFYAAKGRSIRAAFNRTYWDESLGFYRVPGRSGDRRLVQYLNILPVAFGLVPNDRIDTVLQKVNDDLVRNNYHLSSTGVYSGRYLLRLLSDAGHVETAYRIVTQTTAPSWGYWIANDIHTMLESWELTSRSYDHHYWASVSSWFFQGLAGIRPAEPGYTRIIIRPAVPKELRHVSAVLDTTSGQVASSWTQQSGRLELTISIPGGTSGEVWCPGEPSRVPSGARFLRKEKEYTIYSIGPGKSEWVSRL